MARPVKDRVTMSFYIERDVAEELRRMKDETDGFNISDFVNEILSDNIDRIGMFGTEDKDRVVRVRLRKKLIKVIQDELDKLVTEGKKEEKESG